MKTKRISGTKEWAQVNVNCCKGCRKDCVYCYARHNAVERFHTVKPGHWTDEVIDQKQVDKKRGKISGVIMFPSVHDIVLTNVDACLIVLKKLLVAGNQVLIVSKPHLECVKRLCAELIEYRDQILFRFTIGALDEKILKYWEPGAPSCVERLQSLSHARFQNFKTSVSIEPMLDAPDIDTLVSMVTPFVSETIWIGTLNHIDTRVKITTAEDRAMVDEIKRTQSPGEIKAIYDRLNGTNPKIRWKDSIKKIMGIESVEPTKKE
jgi:DNA repair photolyase